MDRVRLSLKSNPRVSSRMFGKNPRRAAPSIFLDSLVSSRFLGVHFFQGLQTRHAADLFRRA